MNRQSIRTERLELIQPSAELFHATMSDLALLSHLLNAHVPAEWPPPLTADAFEPLAEALATDPALAPWSLRYWVQRTADNQQRVLVGLGGFKGRPVDGTVAIGYSMLERYQRQGLATEAVSSLTSWALGQPSVTRIIGETFPELTASIRVLEKNSFVYCDDGSDEPDAIRFERLKPCCATFDDK